MRTMLRLLLVHFFLISIDSMAQVTESWVARFPTSDPPFSGEVTAQAIDDKGNTYVTGTIRSVVTGNDYTTIKYNAAGVLQWVVRYNGPVNGYDEAIAIAVDEKGSVYVTGFSEGIGTSRDYATIKYNEAGVLQWVARYNGPGDSDDAPEALLVDDDENVYVTGSSTGSGTSGYDYATIKYGPDGSQKWISRYNGPGNSTDIAVALALDRKGNVLVTGRSVGSGSSYDYATVAYNSSGVQKWVARFNGAANDFDNARSVAVDKGGNVYVTGATYSGFIPDDPFPVALIDIATVKYNADGAQQWVAIHDETGGTDEGTSVKLDKSGNPYVAGSLSNSPLNYEQPDLDFGVIKYSPEGVTLWVAKYGPPPGVDGKQFYLSDAALDKAGSVYVTGQSADLEFATVKFDENGVLQWAVTYKNGVNQSPIGVDVDKWGNVYVTGNSDTVDCLGCYDFTTIKYSQHAGGKEVTARIGQLSENANNTSIPGKFQVRVAPNPAASITKIYYELPVDGRVSIRVFDMLGRQVATLEDAARSAGFHNTDFNVTILQAGTYVYRIRVKTTKGDWQETGKISVIK